MVGADLEIWKLQNLQNTHKRKSFRSTSIVASLRLAASSSALAALGTHDYKDGRRSPSGRPYLILSIRRTCRASAGVQEKWSCADGPNQFASTSKRRVAMAGVLRTRRRPTRCPPPPLLLPERYPHSDTRSSRRILLCRGLLSTAIAYELCRGMLAWDVAGADGASDERPHEA